MKNIACLILLVALAMATAQTEVTDIGNTTTTTTTTTAAALLEETRRGRKFRETCTRNGTKFVKNQACLAYCIMNGYRSGHCNKKDCICTKKGRKL
uniref:Acp27a n=1 Tax=Drosophila arizonae TaxID=7263 RepID=Q2VKA2_DROAR|nr:Acp27a [Drosophila arizonae]AAZ42753.1 Acp27a [Drosophila arizonae]AAZ42754.1 Acp27a [Drosophila arizonae]AAZ42755.1 Acp27a [Drosophila arizonae]AAZ42757.1 Acp27a [Drosophila arizonae]